MVIADVAVPDDNPGVGGEHAVGVDVIGGPPAGVHAGEVFGAGDVDVSHALPGLDPVLGHSRRRGRGDVELLQLLCSPVTVALARLSPQRRHRSAPGCLPGFCPLGHRSDRFCGFVA
jgi:hypothetical protein